MAPSPDPAGNPILIAPSIERGDRACIVMDDSSGGDHESLEDGRRLWAGVALEPVVAQTLQLMFRRLEMPNRMGTGHPVIHFTDLAGGQGRYRNMKDDVRLTPIRQFGELFLHFKLPVLIVQIAPSDVETLRTVGHQFLRLPGIDTTQPDALALMTCFSTLHKNTFDHYDGELSVVADRWRGNEHRVQPLIKDGRTIIDGLIPRGIAFMPVENFPLLQLADFAAWGYSRLELMYARGVETMNVYQREVFDILTQASREWRTYGMQLDGSGKLLTLLEVGM